VHHFHEIWQPVQSEVGGICFYRSWHFHYVTYRHLDQIRTILHDYLSDRERTSPNNLHSPTSKVNDSFKQRSQLKTRDRTKQLFKFVNEGEDPALHRAYNTIKSDVQTSLKRQIQNFAPVDSKQHSTNYQSIVVDMFANTLVVKEHKLLIKPNAYNVSVLLKPTMSFLQRLKELFPK
jgi:exocyst complex component 4